MFEAVGKLISCTMWDYITLPHQYDWTINQNIIKNCNMAKCNIQELQFFYNGKIHHNIQSITETLWCYMALPRNPILQTWANMLVWYKPQQKSHRHHFNIFFSENEMQRLPFQKSRPKSQSQYLLKYSQYDFFCTSLSPTHQFHVFAPVKLPN